MDIGEWPSDEEIVTPSGWTVNGIDAYQTNKGVTFNAVGDYAVSPQYQGFVTQLVLQVCSTSSPILRYLKAIPEEASSSARTWTLEATSEAKYSEQSFAWKVSEGIRRFRLQIEGPQGGNWRVGSLTVYLDRVDPPTGLREINAHSDALSVGWQPEVRAASYGVEVAQVETLLPKYELQKEWDFSSLTNISGNPKTFVIPDGLPPSLRDVEGRTLNLPKREGGYIQIGNSSTGGLMLLPLPETAGRIAVTEIYRCDKDGNFWAFVGFEGPRGETNEIATVHLGTNVQTRVFAIPDAAEKLIFRSERGDNRIRVADVKIVTDYEPGSVKTNTVASVSATGCEKVVKGLAPGDWLWRVRSFDREGMYSEWSPYREATLDADAPSFDRPGFLLFLR